MDKVASIAGEHPFPLGMISSLTLGLTIGIPGLVMTFAILAVVGGVKEIEAIIPYTLGAALGICIYAARFINENPDFLTTW